MTYTNHVHTIVIVDDCGGGTAFINLYLPSVSLITTDCSCCQPSIISLSADIRTSNRKKQKVRGFLSSVFACVYVCDFVYSQLDIQFVNLLLLSVCAKH